MYIDNEPACASGAAATADLVYMRRRATEMKLAGRCTPRKEYGFVEGIVRSDLAESLRQLGKFATSVPARGRRQLVRARLRLSELLGFA